MNHYFLWTDQCFLGVLIVTFILIIRGLRKEQNRGVFLAIIKKPIAASASIILLFFLMNKPPPKKRQILKKSWMKFVER